MSACLRFRRKIAWRQYALTYDYPEDFVLMRWQTTNLVDGHYLLFRVLFLLSGTIQIHLLGRNASSKQFHKMYIYFTHWTFWSICLYALLDLVGVTIAYVVQQGGSPQDSATKHTILEWRLLNCCTMVMANICHNCTVCVVCSFWIFGFTQEATDLTWACKMYHIWMGIMIVLNYLLTSIPLKMTHVYCPLVLGLFYGLFSFGFYLCDGEDFSGRRYIYKMMDWYNKPYMALGCVLLSLAFVVLVHFCLYWTDRFKFWVYYKCFVAKAAENDIQNMRGFNMI